MRRISCSVKLQGEYKIEVFTGNHCDYESPWFDNLITDSGLDQIAVGDYALWCGIGIGLEPVLETDVSLNSFLISTDNVVSTLVGTNVFTRSFDFEVGTVIANISEVAIGWNEECTPIFSRALLPKVVGVTVKQQVKVTYKLTIVPPSDDYVYYIVLSGNNDIVTTCTARAAFVGNAVEWAWGVDTTRIQFKQGVTVGMPCIFNGPIGTTNQYPSGSLAIANRITNYDYILGTYYLEMQGFWNLNTGIFTRDGVGGIESSLFLTNGYGAFQIGFIPSITKTCYNELKLHFRISWERI